MAYLGDLAEDAIVYFEFTSRTLATGVPIILTGTPSLAVYKDDNTTQSTAGITLTASHDSIVGKNNVKIDTSADAFYAVGSDYSVVIAAGTVDGNSVIGEVVGTFSIENRFDVVSLAATGLDAIASTATGMVEIAKAVWDRVLIGATHNINTSAGKRLRQVAATVFSEGTAQSGGNNSIQLAAGAVTADDQFRRSKIIIISGTGAGQEAIITSSVASTDTLTITPTWLTNPDNTSDYEIIPGQAHSTTQNGGYEDASVWFSSVIGASGVELYVNATSTNPSNTIADLRTIADALNLKRIMSLPGSVLTLDQSYNNFQFGGENDLIVLNGQSISGATFARSGVTGVGVGDPVVVLNECAVIGPCTLNQANFLNTGFIGTFTCGARAMYTFDKCLGSEPLAGANIFDMDGDNITTTEIRFSGWQGKAQINNGTATDIVTFQGGSGEVIIDATCVGLTVHISGNFNLTDNGTSTTITQTANITQSTINAEVVDVITVDTLAEVSGAPAATATLADKVGYVYAALRNKMTVTASTKTFFDDAGSSMYSKTLSDDNTTYQEDEAS